MKKRKIWTNEERKQLRRDYADTPTHVLAMRFGRTDLAVYHKAYALGLRKSAAYLASPDACRLRRGDDIGKKSRFKKGRIPHNAGQKGWQAGGNSQKTKFKPGHRPYTWQPIGAERITKDGYRQRKVTDTGHPPRDWVGLHILLWKEHRGEVPPGHIVVFRNGNKTDIRIDNLELITRAENMRRNAIHRYPPALKETIRLAGKLRREINEKQNRRSAKPPVRHA